MSSYLELLPAWMRRDELLARVLLAFERTLSGVAEPVAGDTRPEALPLERVLDRIHTYFRAGPDETDETRAPAEFVPWLARWVGVSLRDDWDVETKRRVVAEAVPLYRLRGTKEGLRKMLEIYVGLSDTVTIYEFENVPHFFQVEITLPQRDPDILARTDRAVRAIIAQEKPANTFYGLRFHFPSMQIVDEPAGDSDGVYVGVNTLLGSQSYTPG